MILYTENPKESTRKLLELTNEFSKVESRSTHKKQLYFYALSMMNQKMKLIICN